MKTNRSSLSGFTLVEILMVMVLIAVLAGLTLTLQHLGQQKAARTRAAGEIQALTAACEQYRAENGSYPRIAGPGGSPHAGFTEGTVTGTPPAVLQGTAPLSPMRDGDPTNFKYQYASLYLYGQLSGDLNYNGIRDAGDGTVYFNFTPSQLGTTSGLGISYLKDPFGNSYGYSTAGAADEDCYEQNVSANPSASHPSPAQGVNPTFDLWSTGGRTTAVSSGSPETTWAYWIKNW